MTELLEYCKSHADDIVETLGQLVMKESFRADKPQVDDLGRWIKARVQSLGAKIDVFPQSSVGDNMLASFGQGPEQVLILCHFDTVWPLGTIGKRPFNVEGGIATGPGVLDMKAGIAITLHAIQALRDLGIELNRTVKVVFNTDEETDSSSSRQLIEQEAKRSAFVLCLEPSFGKEGALKTARKGVGSFDLTITGRAAHAGNDPENGISAVEELAHQVLRLKDLADPPIGTTITVWAAQGGTVRNQVAPHAQALVDVRVPTREEGERVTKGIYALTPAVPGATIQVSGGMERVPMERTEAVGRLYSRTSDIAFGLGMELQEAKLVGGGSDGQLAAALGIPVLDGLGGVGEGPHADSEYVFVDSLPQRTALLAALLVDL